MEILCFSKNNIISFYVTEVLPFLCLVLFKQKYLCWEAYLEPSRISMAKVFGENCWQLKKSYLLLQESSIVNAQLGSKCTTGIYKHIGTLQLLDPLTMCIASCNWKFVLKLKIFIWICLEYNPNSNKDPFLRTSVAFLNTKSSR